MGGTAHVNVTDPVVAGVQIQTSVYGSALPVVFGKTRVPANLIYFNDFTAIPHTSTQNSGGKGGGVSTTTTTYTYTGTVMMGLCAGAVLDIVNVWADKDKYTKSSTIFTTHFALFTGAFGQAKWSWLTTNHPGHDYPYSGIAYIASNNYDMGGTGTLKNMSFEVIGYSPFNHGGGNDDAAPSAIVNAMLSDQYEGVGFPAAQMGDFTSAGDFYKWTVANGLFMSPCFNEQKPLREILTDLMNCVSCDFIWSQNLLKPLSYGDATVSGNGATYTPNLTPLYDLTDDDYIGNATDPIIVTRKPTADAWNWVQIEFLDRANDYNPSIAEAKDQANIELYGLRPSPVIQMHGLVTQATARLAAQLVMQRALYVRNQYDFNLSWRYCLLEPMDLVTLTDSGLGLNKKAVRIVSIEEDEHGKLKVIAEEWPFGVASPTLYGVGGGTGYQPNQQSDPGNANTPVIFEPPLTLTGGQQVIYIATSGGTNWGGANIWTSQDGTTYLLAGTTYGCRHGVLSSTFASGSDPDVTNTCAIDLTVSRGSVTAASASDYAALLTPCWVAANSGAQGEIIVYRDATLTASYKYNLTTLRRGMYGTPIASHASTNAFVRLDSAVFQLPTPQGMVGKTLYVKLQSFNTTGGGVQSLASLSATTYTVQGNGAGSIPVVTGVTLAVSDLKPF